MARIQVETRIEAPIERVFDLARSIDLHTISTTGTSEKAVAGVTTGLIGLGETVTWEARHFGVKQRLTVRITEFEHPTLFADEMLQGAFRSMRHEHRFVSDGPFTIMCDDLQFQAPLGPLGALAEALFLTRYMRRFLIGRNQILKDVAESDRWREFVK